MKVTLIAAISADGKIAERTDQSSMDWTSKEDKQFFVEKTKEAGTLVMGRKTFATINKGLKGRRIIVLTRDPSKELPIPGVEFTSEEPVALVRRLENEGVAELVLGGGASVYGQFLNAGLVTEVYLTVEPFLFGGGVTLAQGFDRVALKLDSVQQLNSQTILLHYTV
ncbi:MAG TPA: dihydrofolate reductase family protein [bacterium]|nr:dihydrofolate reductase family protein [bacterium]